MKITPKGWGWEIEIVNLKYCGKLIYVKSGCRSSHHYHKEKDETFFVLAGCLRLRIWESTAPGDIEMTAGGIYRIPAWTRHRFSCPKIAKFALFIEFSTHHKDSDSIRLAPGDSQEKSEDQWPKPPETVGRALTSYFNQENGGVPEQGSGGIRAIAAHVSAKEEV